MSIGEVAEELDLDLESQEVAEYIARQTVPGSRNTPMYEGLQRAVDVVPTVIQDLNNWFEIVDVRVLGEDHIGIPMRYRWTIIRWANQDMDQWLEDHGWEDMAHLNADSRTRQENELEARYRKQFGDVVVDCNFLVFFPDEVFEALSRDDIDNAKRKKRRKASLEEIIEQRRS